MKRLLKKSIKKIIYTIAVSFVLCLTSCKSANVTFPGTKQFKTDEIFAQYELIGDEYLKNKNYTKAIEYYQKASKDKNNYWSITYKLAKVNALQKNWVEAQELYTKLLERDPENSSLEISLAYITAMSGDSAKAIEEYKNLVEKYPDNESLLINYISVLLTDKKAELAEEKYFVLKQKFPDSTSIQDIKTKLKNALPDFTDKE